MPNTLDGKTLPTLLIKEYQKNMEVDVDLRPTMVSESVPILYVVKHSQNRPNQHNI
jgi:hypothetical protein